MPDFAQAMLHDPHDLPSHSPLQAQEPALHEHSVPSPDLQEQSHEQASPQHPQPLPSEAAILEQPHFSPQLHSLPSAIMPIQPQPSV
jgi:hypothetical protein